MWIIYALSVLLFLFGVALMFGKCGSVIDGINHMTGAWDGYVTKIGHFRLKGLQSMGFSIAIALIAVKYRLGYKWLNIVAYAILLVAALGVYYLEGKLYVNVDDE